MEKIIRLSMALLILFLMGCQPSKNVTTYTTIEKFPEEWLGEWEGNLEIFNSKGKSMDVYMGLNILPIDSTTYTWTIIYGEGKTYQERKYELRAKDAGKGHYLIDEKNSIVLDDFLLGNTLYSRFEVMGTLLLISYEKVGDTIIFRTISGKSDPISTTGAKDRDTPKVQSFFLGNGQKATLRRKD